MWSASSNGQIVGWDPVTLTTKKEVSTARCKVMSSDPSNSPTVLPAGSVCDFRYRFDFPVISLVFNVNFT